MTHQISCNNQSAFSAPQREKMTPAEIAFFQMLDCNESGQYNKALDKANEALKKLGENESTLSSFVWNEIGKSKLKLQKYEQAAKAFQKVIETGPKDPQINADTYLGMARTHLALGNKETAHIYAKMGVEQRCTDSTKLELWKIHVETRQVIPPTLYTACLGIGDFDQVKRLLEAGADPNEKDDVTGETPLMVACCSDKNVFVCGLLVKYGVHIEETNNIGQTALSIAQESGAKKVADLLKDIYPYRLFEAAQTNNTNTMEKILSQTNCDLDWEHPKTGETALMVACRSDENVSACALLVMYGAHIEETSNIGKTALSIAEESGATKVAALLKAIYPYRLFEAAQTNNTNRMKKILSQTNCDLDWVHPKTGETALMAAVRAGASNAVELIVQKGASVKNIKNTNGQNALQIAQSQETPNSTIINALTKATTESAPISSSSQTSRPRGRGRLVRSGSSSDLSAQHGSSSQTGRPPSPAPDQFNLSSFVEVSTEEPNLD